MDGNEGLHVYHSSRRHGLMSSFKLARSVFAIVSACRDPWTTRSQPGLSQSGESNHGTVPVLWGFSTSIQTFDLGLRSPTSPTPRVFQYPGEPNIHAPAALCDALGTALAPSQSPLSLILPWPLQSLVLDLCTDIARIVRTSSHQAAGHSLARL